MNPPDLSRAELDRYARHLTLPGFGIEAQRRLRGASVLCIGAGGLGSPAAMYLAAAGVGRLAIVDGDRVDASNLQRQLLHGESSLGRAKTDSAAARLRDVNPHVELVLHPRRLDPDNALELLRGHDLVLDGSDNFPTRFLGNDAAFLLGIPNVYGSVHRFEGQFTVFAPARGGPCLRCMMPELPAPGAVPSCAEAGVIGVLPGVIGCLQALEAIKLLAGIGEPAIGRLVHFDALGARFRELRVGRDPACRLCGGQPAIRSVDNPETRADAYCTTAAGRPVPEIDVATLRRRMGEPGFDAVVLDVRTGGERALASIEGSRHLPLAELGQRLDELDPAREWIVHCASGVRSLAAARTLLDAGFPRVAHVTGGIREWITSGFPLARS